MDYPYSKEEFLQITSEIRALLASKEHSACSCPNTRCELHGDCYNCIRVYRHFGHHVPRCLQFVLDRKMAAAAQVLEKEMTKRPSPPEEYYDYRDAILPIGSHPQGPSSE